ncbi:PEP-CTERM sorting domain-containing protein [Floridanema evergladense]|uniref:PEP-CTERM sorting domain-containing protein n=1 Tax=Floridaenema evergladense BLCC-F167 TaxID=3153639 RepID=A0ABV4WSG5_9CYAN
MISTQTFIKATTLGFAAIAVSTTAYAAPTLIDLRTWTKEGPPANGNWVVSPDGTSVFQTINGYPTFFVSPDNFINTTINGKFKVEEKADDDFIGFVFGYQSPIAANGDKANEFNFILFDWNQGINGQCPIGFSLAKVNGTITDYTNFCKHKESNNFDLIKTDFGKGKGWKDYTEYDFSLLYQTDRIKIDIDGETIFDVSGKFQPGRFGFYNMSQSKVRYSGFTQEETSPSKSVPEPTSALGLLAFGTFGAASLLKHKQQQKVLNSVVSD